MDADNFEGKAHQDRREGGDSCPQGHLPDGGGGSPTGVVPSYFGSHRPLARARLVQWMNENHMKTSVITGEVSLRWAKKADQRAKTVRQRANATKLLPLGIWKKLANGKRWQEKRIAKTPEKTISRP